MGPAAVHRTRGESSRCCQGQAHRRTGRPHLQPHPPHPDHVVKAKRRGRTAARVGVVWRYIAACSLDPRCLPGSPSNTSADSAIGPDPAAADDHRLIRDFLAGRAGADAAIAARLGIVPRILGSLCRRLGFRMQPQDLEDTAQDAMAIALRKLGSLPPQVPLDAWLHRLCNYELSNSLRRLNRERRQPVPAHLTSSDGAAVQQLERREIVFAALDQLRPEDANIVRMHQLDGRTLADVAARLGVTENTVKGRYYRAIERLTAILQKHRPGREEP
jgi:RNA polymerase sigma factor (sigma-70 family)